MKSAFVFSSLLLAGSAVAAPAIVFDMGGKFDKSFNESAYTGAEAFKEATGEEYGEFEITNEGQREQALMRLAQRGYNPIVAMSFSQAPIVDKIAPQFPEVNFTIIDAVVEQPNVRSVIFKEHEGSFLVGALAAMKSDNANVGFVGGMDIPLIRKFACGYEQGAKYINADVTVQQAMTGTDGSAWNNPTKGGELARNQFASGADVIYAAAGNTGTGVYQAAADEGKLAIGVDSNQNYLHPGTMLTSMVKRVDVAVREAFEDGMSDEAFETGLQTLGLAENGVDWALDEHNRDLISEEEEARINEIRQQIIDGEIEVAEYSSENGCEY